MKTTLLLTLLFALSTQAQDNTSLADEMESLQIPENQLPVGVEQERLYSVQDRHSSLKYRPEIGVNGGYNFTNNSYLRSFQGSVEGRFHLSNKFSVAAAYTWVSNEFSKDAKSLIDDKGVLPNVPYVMNKTEATVAYNVFYGKFRLAMDTVYYFDQYVALGAGQVNMNNGTETAYIGDIGFAFWLSTWGTLRVGVKDYYYKETYPTGRSAFAHNIHAHLGMGYLF